MSRLVTALLPSRVKKRLSGVSGPTTKPVSDSVDSYQAAPCAVSSRALASGFAHVTVSLGFWPVCDRPRDRRSLRGVTIFKNRMLSKNPVNEYLLTNRVSYVS
jgi:hypothetical protein